MKLNKNEYLKALGNLLAGLPEEEKNDILYDYEEHFRIGTENGKSEEEIASSLGDVRAIAKQYKANFTIQQAQENASASNIFKAVLATVGLGFFNLVFVFGPFMGLVGVLIGLFAAAFGITIAGIASFIAVIISPLMPNLIDTTGNTQFFAFASIGITCMGLLFFILDCYLAKFFFKGTVKYLKWNMEIIKK
jgi:uncharacterized membrane protein